MISTAHGANGTALRVLLGRRREKKRKRRGLADQRPALLSVWGENFENFDSALATGVCNREG